MCYSVQGSLGMKPIWESQWNWLGATKSSRPGNQPQAFAVPNRSLRRKWFLGVVWYICCAVFVFCFFVLWWPGSGVFLLWFNECTWRCQLRFSRRTATSCSHWRLSMDVSSWSGCARKSFSSAKSMDVTILILVFFTSQRRRTFCATLDGFNYLFHQVPSSSP